MVAALAFLCFFPVDFTLEGNGKLRPKLRKPVWSEIAGEMKQLHVEHDSPVKKGQLLLTLESRELDRQIADLDGQLAEQIKRLRATNFDLRSNNKLTNIEKVQKESEVSQIEERIKSLNEQLRLRTQEKEKLEVRSPMDGLVVTWNLEERLGGRPVNRGENLLEIADPTGPWELEVTMPENRMGHIAEAMSKGGGPLPVTFFLATNPEKKLEGNVEEVHRSAEVRGDEGNTVLIRVSFDQQKLREAIGDPKIGAGATAKVHCGNMLDRLQIPARPGRLRAGQDSLPYLKVYEHEALVFSQLDIGSRVGSFRYVWPVRCVGRRPGRRCTSQIQGRYTLAGQGAGRARAAGRERG